ncbi:DUF6478 family protein [Jannaschia rubra]|uniref:Uncharacterized protein n=1 Tax=Jannaschia rubra TaxID=282197 RepID=A0A0M6XR05_9RHOB|nr:DUF6478 family protein [Jannaschia rubra]CTQ32605.1 hypothetical protein JAN5088_01376 [Jannaschia rubra]SFF85882.1 hypothetical protein SAMN04488517_101539 [Jannaschia rubra]
MAEDPPGLIDGLRSRRSLRRWRRAARDGGAIPLADLARLAPAARALAVSAGYVTRAADRRLLGAGDGMECPPQCDWAWRPDPWAAALSPVSVAGALDGTRLAQGVTLFHDCPMAEITLHQHRRTSAGARAPFALSMDVLGFHGSFLSLAIDLPQEAAQGLRRSHIVIVSARLRTERPTEAFVRLNIRQGPNTEQLISQLQPGDRPGDPLRAEFDLGFHDLKPAKLESAWIDLIIERPEMTQVTIDDLTLTRRPRADI